MIHKKVKVLLGTLALTSVTYAQQPAQGSPPANNTNAQSAAAWYRGGNTATTPNNIFGTAAGFNSPIYTVTNGVNRTVLMGTNPAGSISGAFGIGSNLFSPLYKFHVQDFGVTASDALGRMIRTDGILALENRWSIFTGTNAAAALERFRISTNAGSNNAYLGTIQNGSFNIRTFDINRMKLNGDNSYTINSYTGQRNGYLLIGINNNSMIGGQNIYTDKGAYSMLHLNGNGTSYQEYGYRPWMDAGVTFTANKDLSYIGLRKLSTVVTTEDITETVFLWSDNPSSSDGPDKLVFRFSGFGGSNGSSVSSDRLSNTDLDALHVAQFTGTGLMGLGNTFGTNASGMDNANYNNPQSLLHMSYDWRNDISNKSYGFGQITYRRDGFATAGTGETSNDGLRWGIDNTLQSTGGAPYLSAYLRWQESTPLIIQTDWNNSTGGIEDGERIRITSVGSLVYTHGSAYGGITANTNASRIAISHLGNEPITKPLSLLHLGYNSESGSGYRTWMDVGTFTTNETDHMYIGLKTESSVSSDRYDAIINWGDNLTGTNVGPDNLRFIFTSRTTGVGLASTQDGLEGMRMTPTTSQGVYTGIGGSYTSNPYFGGVINPTATLEVNSWGATNVNGGSSGLRFTNLNTTSPKIANPGTGILAVNENGDVIYVDAPSSSTGASCNAPATSGALNTDTRLNLNNNNFYFTNLTTPVSQIKNKVGIGYICGTPLVARFNVLQNEFVPISNQTTAGFFNNKDISTNIFSDLVGVIGVTEGLQVIDRVNNTGGFFVGRNAGRSYGVKGHAFKGSFSNPFYGYTFGGEFIAENGKIATGVETKARNATETNYGVYSIADGGETAFGIYASGINGSVSNRAGYFVGQMETTAGALITSDQQFKTNVNKIEGSLKAIQALRPVNYYMDTTNFTQFSFDSKQQFGFIAQELETTFPNLVYKSLHPAQYDTLGNEISPAVSYKSLNYNGLIPINTQAIIELNQKVDRATLSDQSIKTNVQDLSSSLDKVLNMHGVSYDWNHNVHPELNLDSANHVGFIAQEIAQIDSRLTYIADDSLLHIEYDKVVPILAEAIQELNDSIGSRDSIISVLVNQNAAQQTTINDLNNRLTQLENCLSGILPFLCQLSQQAIETNTPAQQEEVRAQLSVRLANKEAIILDQNVPNPFAEQTVINFSIPATVQKAQIHFYDSNGKIIQSVDVVERGLGSLTVFGADLSTGIYTYTLVADGQIVATKKMMKE